MAVIPFNTDAAVRYALRWALSRNPEYYNFSDLGGDCTNFISQCIYAGSNVMNYDPIFGWYYISSYDRAPAWTDVEFFYDFFTGNEGVGPFASEISSEDVTVGDVIQFSSPGNTRFNHTLIVTRIIPGIRPIILVCAHTDDAFMRPLYTYKYRDIRFLHIDGVRI